MILIGGMPRSGTTLLTTILHNSGFDCGYDKKYINKVNDQNYGGLEFFRDHYSNSIKIENIPQVVKHPTSWRKSKNNIVKICSRYGLENCISLVIICHRNPDKVIDSQIRRKQKKPINESREELKTRLVSGLGWLILDCHKRSLNFTLLEYPRYVNDLNYFLKQLGESNVNRENIKNSWKLLIDKNLTHVK